jgi:hypothetical protein
MAATGKRRSRWILGLVLLAAAVAGLFPFLSKTTSELPVYVTGAERMAAGQEIYRGDDAKPFTYPPFFALLFVPATWLPHGWHRPLWYAVNVLLLAWMLRAVDRFARSAAPERPWRPGLFWVVVGALSARHVTAVFENQSHDLIVAAAVTATALAWAGERASAAGAWAGAAAALKATPLLLAVPFALSRRVAALAGLTAAALAFTLLPDVLAPRPDGHAWVRGWFDVVVRGARPGGTAELAGTWSAGSILNQSLSGTVYRLTTPVPPAAVGTWSVDAAVVELSPAARRAAILLAQALVLAAVAWCARPRLAGRGVQEPLQRFGQVAAVACGMVLLSPMSSKSHFCVLLLPYAFCAADLVGRRVDAVAVFLLSLSFAAGSLTAKGLWGSELGNLILARGSVTWSALFALLATARVLAVRCRAWP